jgi:hypothetical protein
LPCPPSLKHCQCSLSRLLGAPGHIHSRTSNSATDLSLDRPVCAAPSGCNATHDTLSHSWLLLFEDILGDWGRPRLWFPSEPLLAHFTDRWHVKSICLLLRDVDQTSQARDQPGSMSSRFNGIFNMSAIDLVISESKRRYKGWVILMPRFYSSSISIQRAVHSFFSLLSTEVSPRMFLETFLANYHPAALIVYSQNFHSLFHSLTLIPFIIHHEELRLPPHILRRFGQLSHCPCYPRITEWHPGTIAISGPKRTSRSIPQKEQGRSS